MKGLLNLYRLLFIWLLPQTLLAQEITTEVNKNTVGINEVFDYEVHVLNGNCQVFKPDFGQLNVLAGPFQSTNSSTTILNGKVSKKSETIYTYKVSAPKAGKYTIPAVRMKCNGNVFKSNTIVVTAQNNQNTTSQTSNHSSDQFYARVYSNKKTVYKGEPFVVTYKMYSKAGPRSIQDLQLADITNVAKKDLDPNKQVLDTEIEYINGVKYYTTILKEYVCFALTENDVEIKPFYVSVIFQKNIFQQYNLEANSNSSLVKVKPFPQTPPADFNALIGDFKLDYTISKDKVKPGEAIDISIKVSGKGNLGALRDPQLKIPDDFEVFDPEIKQNYKDQRDGVKGSVSYNFVLIPTFYGDYTIPAYHFSYFDIKSQTFKQLSTSDFNIHVDKANQNHGEIIQHREEVEAKENDIRYIHINSNSTFKTSDLLANTFLFYLGLTIPILGIFILLGIKNKRAKMNETDLVKQRQKKAKRTGEKYLHESRQYLKQGKDKEGIQALYKGLRAYFKDKLNLNETQLNVQHILSQLKNESTQNQLKQLWSKLEMAQYAGVAHIQLSEVINEVKQMIQTIEKEIK